MSATTDQILEQLKSLSLLEASELVKQIEEAFGVSAAASAGVVMAAPAAGGAAEAAEEKTEFDVILEGFDAAAKIKVLKAVREATGLGLGEADSGAARHAHRRREHDTAVGRIDPKRGATGARRTDEGHRQAITGVVDGELLGFIALHVGRRILPPAGAAANCAAAGRAGAQVTSTRGILRLPSALRPSPRS